MEMSKKVMKKMDEANEKARAEYLERCLPIAQAIQKMIVEDELEMGNLPGRQAGPNGQPMPVKDGDRPEKYVEAAKKIIKLFVDNNLLYLERELVFQLLKQPYDMLQDIVLTDTTRILNETMNSMMGISHYGELTFQMIDALTKKHHPKLSEQAVEANSSEDAASN